MEIHTTKQIVLTPRDQPSPSIPSRTHMEQSIRDESSRLSSLAATVKTKEEAVAALHDGAARLFNLVRSDDRVYLPSVLAENFGVPSLSEGRRLIATGAVTVNGKPFTELDAPRTELDGAEVQVIRRRVLDPE